jgi:hypothetical protein
MALLSADITYPPLDTLKPVADDLWIVDSGPLWAMGILPLPVRMTVIRLSSGDILLHSPTRFDPALHRAIEALGPIRHLVAPNIAHWTLIEGWQRACPDATTWAAPVLRKRPTVKKSKLRLDRELGEAAPPEWAADMEHVIVPGRGGFREVCFLHKASRTLILTDLVVNLEPAKLPLPMRLFAKLAGMTAGRAPVYLRAVVRGGGEPARTAARRLVDWAPERVIFAHGRPFERDGAAALRRSLDWLLT